MRTFLANLDENQTAVTPRIRNRSPAAIGQDEICNKPIDRSIYVSLNQTAQSPHTAVYSYTYNDIIYIIYLSYTNVFIIIIIVRRSSRRDWKSHPDDAYTRVWLADDYIIHHNIMGYGALFKYEISKFTNRCSDDGALYDFSRQKRF